MPGAAFEYVMEDTFMSDMNVTIVLPSGGARAAEVPDDVELRELMPELSSLLELPTVGPDGRPMSYRLDSKALGRELKENETLSSAGIPENDRLMLTADITAGSVVSVAGSPRMRRLKNDFELMQELTSRSDMIDFKAMDVRPGVPPERYIVTFACKSIIGVDKMGKPQYGNRHKVEIYLHTQYPQRWPGMKWMTPIWHPNINHLNGSVCIDAAWWTASRSLDRLSSCLVKCCSGRTSTMTRPSLPSPGMRKRHVGLVSIARHILMNSRWTIANFSDRNA